MFEWIADNAVTLFAAVLGAIGFVLSLFGIKVKTPAVNVDASKAFAALKVALEMLPNFITFSEKTNEGAPGEIKEAFVLTFVESVYNARGLEFSDADRETVKKHIASIVKATKAMHTTLTEGKKNEDNSRNDIDGVTGLRAIS